ncbi:MAG TPA: hypothetical protein VG826_32645 [Pirellulales bacterium]|nr:hypothetical protein [Pirellulales bacterium]
MSASLCLVISAAALSQQPCLAPADTRPSSEAAKTIEDFKADARQYVLRLDARPDAAFTLHEEPLLHWGNPARTGEDGAVFVWLLDGRPQAIGRIFTYRYSNVIRRKHEYHSLASGPLTATYQGQRVWAPRTSGISFKPVPDAPALPPTSRGRSSQIKMLARNFSARIEDSNGKKDELRLLTQPLFRYETTDKKTDGALFSFSLGTDPEVILILEANLKGGGPPWQYAFARYHFVDLHASYDGREVWHAEPLPAEISSLEIGTSKFQDSVYATYHTQTTPIEEAE